MARWRDPWLAAGAALLSAAAAAQPVADPIAADGDRLIQSVWDAQLQRCGGSAFEVLDGRVVLELEQPRFHLAPTRLHPAAKQNGYEYQTTAIASARRWRWAPLAGARVGKWSDWQEGQTLSVRFDEFGAERGQTTVTGAVLQFDLVRKDGKWQANFPLSPLNVEIRPLDPTKVLPSASSLDCRRLAGRS